MGQLHQLHVIMGYKSATPSEQDVKWVSNQVHVIMECKSATPSQQYVESLIYINLTLSWDSNLPPPLSNMLNGLFTPKFAAESYARVAANIRLNNELVSPIPNFRTNAVRDSGFDGHASKAS